MLESLRRIVQEVNTAKNLQETLEIMVNQIQLVMHVDACNVYLCDHNRQVNILMATHGLRVESLGKVRLKLTEGIVGLVRERAEPVNLEDAQTHPNYSAVHDTDEFRFHGFLGVPIIHFRRVIGVLVVRQKEHRKFAEEEVAFLVTLAAQLAGTIVHAIAQGDNSGIFTRQIKEGKFIEGLAGSPGIAIGTAVVLYPVSELYSIPNKEPQNIQREIESFQEAVEAVRQDMQGLADQLAPSLPTEDRALFDVYMLMLKSDSLIKNTIENIKRGNWAPGALRETVNEHSRMFQKMEDSYIRERAGDLEDIARRILLNLQKAEPVRKNFPDRTVLIGEDVSASMLAEVPRENLSAVVSVKGSGSSHVAILCRAMGVPAVMGADDLPVSKLEGQKIIVDGYVGRVYVAPSEEMLNEFYRLAREEEEMSAGLEALSDLPAVTLDSHHIPLYANTGLLADITPSLNVGAEGIGLYRTEFPFLIRDRFPSEDEQRKIYQQVLETFSPRPVVLRTLDIGGDKMLPYFPIKEDNPFLGWRGIRVTLDHPEIFLVQIRAMMRAGAGLDNLHILLPMVSSVGEVDEALKLIHQSYEELLQEEVPVHKPKVGVMIEVPSAVYLAKAFAKRVDFLSIGTNDLTQYILAVDRNNARVASLYDSLEPAVLQALQHVSINAHAFNKPVSVCGEMAGDPAAVLLLMGMGMDSLSMSATSLPRIKWVIQSFTKQAAEKMLEDALDMEDAVSIRNYLHSRLEEADLGGLVRAGK